MPCSTSGAAIRYTTDGTTPTKTSSLYTTPISISGMGSAYWSTRICNGYRASWTSSGNNDHNMLFNPHWYG
ncbi:MAG: chitobiase/beta-hexosaminidase C-terminal domain-containing protein [Armatimonadota bacterium]